MAALSAVGAGLLLQMMLVPLFGVSPNASPFMAFFAAVMVAAWFGGLGPGLLATGLSTLLSWYFFLSPQYSFALSGFGQGLRLVVFALEGGVISWLAEAMHSASRRAERTTETIRESEERFRVLVEGAADYAMLLLDPDGRVVSWNSGAQRLLGYAREEIVGEHFSVFFTEEDRRAGKPQRELEKASTEGSATDDNWAVRKDGSRFWVSGVTTALRDGHLRGFAKIMRDLTARKRTEETQRLLVEASEVLSSSLDYRDTLASVARLAVPALADWCAVDVVAEDGSLERLAVEHPNPQKVALAYKLQKRYPPDPDNPGSVHQVLRSGEPQMMTKIPPQLIEEATLDEEHREILRELGLKAYIIVPLVARGRTLGTITLVTAESERRYGEADLHAAQELARRAALAVDNAKLYEEAQNEIAEREWAQQELRGSRDQLEVILRGAADGITAQDSTGRLIYANDAAARMAGFTSAREFIEAPLSEVMRRFEVLDEEGGPFATDRLPGRRVLQGEAQAEAVLRYRVFETGEERWSIVKALPVLDERGRVRLAVNIFRDITERRKAEEALRIRAHQQEAVAELGRRALGTADLGGLMNEAVELVALTLGVEYCKVVELLAGGDELLLRAGAGWEEELVGHITENAGLGSQEGYTLLLDEPVVVEDLESEARFSASPLLRDHGVVSGISTVIRGREKSFGVLAAHTRERRSFTENDVLFLRAVANVLAAAVERQRAEDAARQMREAERRRIARELHDGVLQDLSYTVVAMEVTKLNVQGSEIEEDLQNALEAIRNAAQELRAAVSDLRLADELAQPFPVLIEALVERNRAMTRQQEIDLRVDEGFPETPLGEAAAEILRIIQEALTNARRHSGARNVLVRLGVKGEELVLEVSDNGRGFGPGIAPGVGSRSMRERAAALGGELQVDSEPGEGTTVRLRIPMPRL